MERVEELAVKLIDARMVHNQSDYEKYKERILLEMKYNALQLRFVKHRYIVSKALVYILLSTKRDNHQYDNLVLQTYYSLLKCILDIKKNKEEDTRCSELAAASKIAFVILSENIKQIAWASCGLLGYTPETAHNQMLRLLYYHYWINRLSEINAFVDDELESMFYKAKLRYNLEMSEAPTIEIEKRLQKDVENICDYIEIPFSHDEDFYINFNL